MNNENEIVIDMSFPTDKLTDRLTCYIGNGHYTGWQHPAKGAQPILDKLGKLEDIEDELGVDLITLFKALKDGVAVKFDNQIWFIHKDYVSIHRSYLFVDYNMPKVLSFKDYGKTWALTKEELL